MKSIMIVDDSRFVFEEMKLFLKDTDYEVTGYAKSGEEALVEYEKIKPDIVTMDIILPGMDGVETTKKIMERWPDARVLMVSSFAYDETINTSEESGAKDFIFKPFDKDTLVGTLTKICSHL